MKHQAQGFDPYTLHKFNNAEETTILMTVKIFSYRNVPEGAIIVNSHGRLYRIKKNDECLRSCRLA